MNIDYKHMSNQLSKRNEELKSEIQSLNYKLKRADEKIDKLKCEQVLLYRDMHLAETCIQFIELTIALWYEVELEDSKSQPFICQIYDELNCYTKQRDLLLLNNKPALPYQFHHLRPKMMRERIPLSNKEP
tara:strand:- start:9386 stop:9778 length:393 start_codon:yes stop_codon:yes gene_type:complete